MWGGPACPLGLSTPAVSEPAPRPDLPTVYTPLTLVEVPVECKHTAAVSLKFTTPFRAVAASFQYLGGAYLSDAGAEAGLLLVLAGAGVAAGLDFPFSDFPFPLAPSEPFEPFESCAGPELCLFE